MRVVPFLLGALLVSVTSVDAQEETPYHREANVVYANAHGVGLVMDVYRPKEGANGHAIVDVLSGAWYSGPAQVRDHTRAQLFHVFCSRGYTVFMIRPGSRTKFVVEEMVQNLKTGIRYVKEHAEEYGIDPERLAITGASAGGHLTLLTLVTAMNADASAEGSIDPYGSDIKAAAVFFPVTDFLDWGGKTHVPEALISRDGSQERSEAETQEAATKISPYRRVKKALPPTLIIHGDADPAVPLEQSEKMIEALKKAGGTAELIVKEGGGHPWPTIHEEVSLFADWFDKYLLNK